MRRALLPLLVVLGPAVAGAQERSERPLDGGLPSEPAAAATADAGPADAGPGAGPAAAAAEPPPPVAPEREERLPGGEPLVPGAEDIGIGFFLGVAACRTGAYPTDPLLTGTSVSGTLLESAADLQPVFDAVVPWSKKGRFYSEAACRDLRRIAESMRYHVELREQRQGAGVTVELRLRPMTLVRHIVVRGNAPIFPLTLSPVFREDIVRRLKLRPGVSLEEEPERRSAQLAEEEQRVRDYLARRGFFDAQVKVTAEAGDRPTEVVIFVDIKKGDGYTVGQVGVDGSTAIDDSVIAEVMRQRMCVFSFLCLWQARFDYDELKNDLDKVRALYQERGYPGVRLTSTYNPSQSADHATKTVRFKVIVKERKKITVEFEGNKSKDDKSLRDLLTFNDAAAYDDIEAQNSAEAIRRSYQGDGRFLTTVRFDREKLSPTDDCPECEPHDAIVFHIDEGPEQRVRSVDFEGNHAFTADQLRDQVKTNPFPAIRYVFGSGGYVTSLQLTQDVDRLVAFYRGGGFSAVEVEARIGNRPGVVAQLGAVAAQVTAADAGDGLHVLYRIVEGPRDVVETVRYHGNSELSAEELAVDARILPGAPFTPAALDADVELLLKRYRDRGFLYVKVTPTRTGGAAHTRVDFAIDEGIRVHAGKLIVRGNFKTRAWVVRDAFRLGEGDTLTISRLESSQTRLRGTDLFAGVHQQLIGRDPVNVILDVEERFDSTLDLKFAGGFSSDSNVFLSLTSEMRHIAGIGVSLAVNGELGLKRQRAQATLVFPQWVMRRATRLPLSLELQGRYRSETTERLGVVESFGFSAALLRQLGAGVLFSLRYDWNRFGRSTDLLRPPGPNADVTSAPISTTTALLGPILLIDRRRPTVLSPTSGWVVQLQLQLASRYLLGTDDFVKLGAAGQLFLPLGQRIILTNTVRYDQGFPLGGEVLLPEVERFSAGGDTTVRGIAQDHLATEVISGPLDPASNVVGFRVVPAGGNIRFLYKVDAQARLFDLVGRDVALASAIFLDNGFIANSFYRFDVPRRFRHSLGAAVRFLSPYFNLSVEWAFPLDPDIGDDPAGRLHVNLGVAF